MPILDTAIDDSCSDAGEAEGNVAKSDLEVIIVIYVCKLTRNSCREIVQSCKDEGIISKNYRDVLFGNLKAVSVDRRESQSSMHSQYVWPSVDLAFETSSSWQVQLALDVSLREM